jgi:carbon-monoxide dehydrogenase large subunit
MTLGGSAMYEGLQHVRQKMALLAAHLLDCRPEDIVFRAGNIVNEHRPEHTLTFAAVAAAAQRREQLPPDMEVGLEFPVHFVLRDNPFGFGAHVAVVEVDRDTGALKILDTVVKILHHVYPLRAWCNA